MSTQNNNPFVLPGFGQSGDLAQNPLMASMEMMRQAWQGMTSSGGLAQPGLTAPMTVEDMDRRIAELRTVENWLRMNLSMLSSSIQALEVQRATVATIKSFITAPASHDASATGPSPLELVLGINQPIGQAKIQPVHKATDAAEATDAQAAGDAATAAVPDAALGWWNMLQKQFDTLAAATTASMQGAEAMQAAASTAQADLAKQVQADMEKQVSASVASVKAAVAKPAKAPKQASATKTSAAKTSAVKAAPRKRATAANKTAAKTTAVKKSHA